MTLKKSRVLLEVTKDVPRATQTLESSDLQQGCQRGDPCRGRRKVFYGTKNPGVRAGAAFRGAGGSKTLTQGEW